MADVYHSSDDSSSSSQSNELNGPNKDDATTWAKKGGNKDGGHSKDERKDNKSKPYTHYEDSVTSPTDTTNKSVEDKIKVNEKKTNKKSLQCDNVQQADGNRKMVHSENRGTFKQTCGGFDHQNERKGTDCDRASNTSRREGTTERISDNRSSKPHDTEDTDSDRTAKRNSKHRSNMSLNGKESACDWTSNAIHRKVTAIKDSDNQSKKYLDSQEGNCDPSSNSSPPEGTVIGDTTSDKFPDTKDVDTNHTSSTSLRVVTAKENSCNEFKMFQDTKEIDYKTENKDEATNRGGKRYEKDGIRRSCHLFFMLICILIQILKLSSWGIGMFLNSATNLFIDMTTPKATVDARQNVVTEQHESTEKGNLTDDSKKSHDANETDYKTKYENARISRGWETNEKGVRRRSVSSSSSSERRRSLSEDKSRNKERYRERGKHGSGHGHRNNRSEQNYSSDDYNRRKYNEESRDAYSYRQRSRDRSAERERPRRRTSSASPINSGKSYDDDDRKKNLDSPKRKEGYRRRYDDEDPYERAAKHEQPNYKHEWQFENEHGKWITYGHSVSGIALQGANTVTSDDIEEFYSTHRRIKRPLLIETNNNQYALDFQKMIQINVETSVGRRFRRVRKREEHSTVREKYDDSCRYGEAGDSHLALTNFELVSSPSPGPEDDYPTGTNESTKFEWQFEDDIGNWITYGKTNSANTVTLTTSDDIEQIYSSDPSKVTMLIGRDRSQYLLNFNQMMQVDIETLGQRRIRRVPKLSNSAVLRILKQELSSLMSSGSSGREVESFEWQFQDERGVWITYGQVNPNGIAAFKTSATSDDIEKYYTSSPNKAPISISSRTHTYMLDFQLMVQINQETLVHRQIRRVKKTSNDRNVNQPRGVGQGGVPGGVGPGGVPAGNGNNAGVINFSNPSHNPGNFGPGSVSQGFNQGDPRTNHLNTPSFPCAWQFQDENGSWIIYGQPSSTKQFSGSTTTSDDIEHYFMTNPGKTSMNIRSPFNNYVLDIQRMTQINQKTQAQKAVRQVLKQTT